MRCMCPRRSRAAAIAGPEARSYADPGGDARSMICETRSESLRGSWLRQESCSVPSQSALPPAAGVSREQARRWWGMGGWGLGCAGWREKEPTMVAAGPRTRSRSGCCSSPCTCRRRPPRRPRTSRRRPASGCTPRRCAPCGSGGPARGACCWGSTGRAGGGRPGGGPSRARPGVAACCGCLGLAEGGKTQL